MFFLGLLHTPSKSSCDVLTSHRPRSNATTVGWDLSQEYQRCSYLGLTNSRLLRTDTAGGLSPVLTWERCGLTLTRKGR